MIWRIRPPDPARPFERSIQALDHESRAEFLADVWEARGWDTRVEEGVAIVRDPHTDGLEILRLDPRGTAVDRRESVDPVSVEADSFDGDGSVGDRDGPRSGHPRPVSVDELKEILQYGIDADDRSRLFRRHFDRGVTLGAMDGHGDHIAGGVAAAFRRIDRWWLGHRGSTRLVGIALVIVLLGVAIAVVAGPDLAVSGSMLAQGSANPLGDADTGASDTTPVPLDSLRSRGSTVGEPPAPNGQGATLVRVRPMAQRDLWSVHRGNPARTGALPAVRGPEDVPVVAATIDLGDGLHSGPTTDGRSIFVGHDEGYLYALNASTLDVRWRIPLGGAIATSPAVIDDTAFVGLYHGNEVEAVRTVHEETLFGINADAGRVKWATDIGSITASSPTMVDGTVYVGTQNARLYAIESASGELSWSTNIGPHSMSSPAVEGEGEGERVYVGNANGSLVALDARSGAVEYRARTGWLVSATPAVENGSVYIGNTHGEVYAFDAASGTEHWSVTINGSVRRAVAVAGGTVYVGTAEGWVYAIDAGTGEPRWAKHLGPTVTTPPVVAGTTLYVGTETRPTAGETMTGRLVAMDVNSGAIRWQYQTAGPIVESPVVTNHALVVADRSGSLTMLVSCEQLQAAIQSAGGDGPGRTCEIRDT